MPCSCQKSKKPHCDCQKNKKTPHGCGTRLCHCGCAVCEPPCKFGSCGPPLRLGNKCVSTWRLFEEISADSVLKCCH